MTQLVAPTATAAKKIKARECRFGVHIATKDPSEDDWHMIKEVVHYEDGTSAPRFRWIKNFERPMWVTAPSHRNHQEKKEFEKKEKLLVKSVRESDLRRAIAQAVGKPWSHESKKRLCASPYIYGTDISSTTIIKKTQYLDKYPNFFTPYSLCTFDTETDVLFGTETIIIATTCFRNEAVVAVTKKFLEAYTDVENRFHQTAKKYLDQHIQKHGLKIHFHVCEDEIDVIRKSFEYIHRWKPDWLAIWNMDFDVNKVLDACRAAGVDPKDILCDPSIPPHLRICEYIQGQQLMITASGKAKPVNPANQWHTLMLTASFYVIDSMCSYRQLRIQEQELPSYSLNAILDKELKLSKLDIPEAEQHKGLAWHQFMQKFYPFEYMCYAAFDSFSMLLLDEATNDLKFTLPSFAVSTDFWDFKSQPRKIRDAIFWYGLREHGVVLGTVGPIADKPPEVVVTPDDDDSGDPEDDDEDGEEQQDAVLDRRNWVVTLPSYLSAPGLKFVVEDGYIHTGLRAYVYDSDVVSSYPNCILTSNCSKGTTKKEVIRIGTIDEVHFRMQNLNIVYGEVNAVDYCTSMFNMPKPFDLLRQFEATL